MTRQASSALDLARLKELALKATPGPWQASGVRISGTALASERLLQVDAPPVSGVAFVIYSDLTPHEHAQSHADQNYIAAANPAAVLALLGEVERLTRPLKELDRLCLVIESSVRKADPDNHGAVLAVIMETRAILASRPSDPAAVKAGSLSEALGALRKILDDHGVHFTLDPECPSDPAAPASETERESG